MIRWNGREGRPGPVERLTLTSTAGLHGPSASAGTPHSAKLFVLTLAAPFIRSEPAVPCAWLERSSPFRDQELAVSLRSNRGGLADDSRRLARFPGEARLLGPAVPS